MGIFCCFFVRVARVKGRVAGAALFGWSRSHFFGPAPTPTNILFFTGPQGYLNNDCILIFLVGVGGRGQRGGVGEGVGAGVGVGVGVGIGVGVGLGVGAGICLELEPGPKISKMGGSGNPGKMQSR